LIPEYRVIPLILQLVVPEAVPDPPLSFDQVTLVTPTSSDAVPPRLIVDDEVEYVGLLVGEVRTTVGASFGALGVALASLDGLPSPAEFQAVTAK
jgi:hypothetical protein